MKHKINLTDAESAGEFQRVSKDMLTHEPASGTNYWAGSPYPTMLLWAGRLVDFLRAGEEVVGFVVARRQSYLVGYTPAGTGRGWPAGSRRTHRTGRR